MLGSLISVLTYLLPVALLVIAWQFNPLRKALLFVLGLIPAFLLFLLGIVAYVLWMPVNWIGDRLAKLLPIERMAEGVLNRSARTGSDPLLAGERQKVARGMWPERDFPHLYEPVPRDIQRPLYEDGRLPRGVGMVWLSDRYMTDAAYKSAFQGGFKAALVVFTAILILLVFDVFGGVIDFIPALLEGERPVIEQWPGAEPVTVSTWSLLTANFGAAATNLAANVVEFALSLLASVPIALGAGILVGLLLLSSWMRAKSEPYRLVTKDADVRWAYRTESRNLLRQTFYKQIEQATGYLKDSPTYVTGVATGTLRARGDLAAPMPGQTLRLDRESLFQHILVFGGTGEGKTTALLKPLLRQVLSDRKFGAFIADAKGVLWQDALSVAKSVGRSDDVAVIGTGLGQQGVDPIASLTPTQVAATLRSVLRQMSGEASDSFWPDMAANMIRHALTIGRAYALTAAGEAEFAETGTNPYSLWWAYRAVTIPGSSEQPGALRRAIGAINQSHELDSEAYARAGKSGAESRQSEIADRMHQIHSSDFLASKEYVEGAWESMATETKTGIIASVTQLLDGFSGSEVLRQRFAEGRAEGIADLRAALDGRIVLNALSSIEDGLPARLTSILLKTALYREARVREAEWKRNGKSPQDKPCIVVMDEVQELATVDPVSGLSDASFWNVARSTGLAGMFATQTIAALAQAMGTDAAGNFIQQSRSKVFFRTEEKETVEYACWCAGEYERNRVYEDGQRESIEYRALIDGWDPFEPVDEDQTVDAKPMAFFQAAIGLINPKRLSVAQAQAKSTYRSDDRFTSTDREAARADHRAAQWRAEDLTRQYRMHGNEREQALKPADLIHMGRWHAFAQVQRAGAVRQDIIRIEHDFS